MHFLLHLAYFYAVSHITRLPFRFLQHGTLVGLLPVPHPILIRKYQPNPGTAMWFRTYMWGVIYLRNTDPPIWYDTDVKLFEIQRV